MTRKITYQDLLLFAFNETMLDDTVRITGAMEGDPLIQADYDELREALRQAESAALMPSEASMRKIMDFAKAAR